VATAPIVPVGMDFEASARSPDLFDPAIMPAHPLQLVTFTTIKQVTGLTLKRLRRQNAYGLIRSYHISVVSYGALLTVLQHGDPQCRSIGATVAQLDTVLAQESCSN